ncbi:hypothetical protein HRI_003984500 [Hibiscus trionum]|uniref:RRM domain-containing protein n=1 Tax=Hibiscus trionum TaxID=183268 RepID=A0A9W7IV44_HIBTR|nr:hypothetical protein HRI_003984500 [Hibiscus trionum]
MESRRGRVGQKSVNPRRRLGYGVFVQNVSKRIHFVTLREAFKVYGDVADVYIAYRNASRRAKPTTFAFVRFKEEEGARLAVERGSDRVMDGYHIKVYPTRIQEGKGQTVEKKGGKTNPTSMPFTDEKSYRDVVIGVRKRGPEDTVNQDGGCKLKEVLSVNVVEDAGIEADGRRATFKHDVEIKKSGMEWRKCCLVGQIKGMYNPDMVQQALMSDGFQVKVSSWYGLLAVIQF